MNKSINFNNNNNNTNNYVCLINKVPRQNDL